MSGQDFSLKPFSPISPPINFKIAGNIVRRSDQLAIRYVLHGPPENLVIPAPAETPARRHGLWEETCFEFFLGVQGSPLYWEFNLSPAGHWNVYRFAGYRQGMTEESAFTSLPLSLRRQPDSQLIVLDVEIERIVAAGRPLAVGLAAVLKFREQGLTYWALTHPGEQADFHRRESFVIAL
jgi:hypothetical protein